MVLFIGDRPSKRSDPKVPFKGAACGKRLMEWIKFVIDDKYLKYKIINQSDYPSLIVGEFLLLGYKIVALGNVASNFCRDYPHFKLPHPSGRNRQINDKEFIMNKLIECKEYIGGKNGSLNRR